MARSITIFIVGMIIVGLGMMLLMLQDEAIPFTKLLFKTVSSLCMAGLSTGAVGKLSEAGQSALIVLMFVGR